MLVGTRDGVAHSTSDAEDIAEQIRNAKGHWAGDITGGSFYKKNRQELADKILSYVSQHKNSEDVEDRASVIG